MSSAYVLTYMWRNRDGSLGYKTTLSRRHPALLIQQWEASGTKPAAALHWYRRLDADEAASPEMRELLDRGMA